MRFCAIIVIFWANLVNFSQFGSTWDRKTWFLSHLGSILQHFYGMHFSQMRFLGNFWHLFEVDLRLRWPTMTPQSGVPTCQHLSVFWWYLVTFGHLWSLLVDFGRFCQFGVQNWKVIGTCYIDAITANQQTSEIEFCFFLWGAEVVKNSSV